MGNTPRHLPTPILLIDLYLLMFIVGTITLATTTMAGYKLSMCGSPLCDNSTVVDRILGQERIVMYDERNNGPFGKIFFYRNDRFEPYDHTDPRHYWASPFFLFLLGLTLTGSSVFFLIDALMKAVRWVKQGEAQPPPPEDDNEPPTNGPLAFT